jgi:hypothetical protein
MKISAAMLLVLACPVVLRCAVAAPPLPVPYPEARYRELIANSPFSLATATPARQSAVAADLTKRFGLEGVARVGKTDFIAIKSRDAEESGTILLKVGEVSTEGVKVDSVKWSGEPGGQCSVEIERDGEHATLVLSAAEPAPSAGVVTFPMAQLPGFHPYRFDPRVFGNQFAADGAR